MKKIILFTSLAALTIIFSCNRPGSPHNSTNESSEKEAKRKGDSIRDLENGNSGNDKNQSGNKSVADTAKSKTKNK